MPSSEANVLAPIVRKLSKLSPLGPAEVEAVLHLPFRLVSMDSRSHLVREGDRPNDCVALLSGFVFRSKTAPGGARQILSIHFRGDLVNLQDGLLRETDHDLQALTPVELAMIPHQAILEAAETFPALGRSLWCESMVEGAAYREWILNLGRRNARQRISHLLCEVATRQVEAGLCDHHGQEWPMTQTQLADATGLTPIHVNRILQGLRRDRLLDPSGHGLRIIDWAGLQAAGDFRNAYLRHQAIEIVDRAVSVQIDVVDEADGVAEQMWRSHALLTSIATSLKIDTQSQDFS